MTDEHETNATSATPTTESSSSSSPSDASASTTTNESDSTTSTSGERKLQRCNPQNFQISDKIYVRGRPAVITNIDYPHVFWQMLDENDKLVGAEKHRSLLHVGEVFEYDPDDYPGSKNAFDVVFRNGQSLNYDQTGSFAVSHEDENDDAEDVDSDEGELGGAHHHYHKEHADDEEHGSSSGGGVDDEDDDDAQAQLNVDELQQQMNALSTESKSAFETNSSVSGGGGGASSSQTFTYNDEPDQESQME